MSTLNVANVTDGTTSVPTGYVVSGTTKSWANLKGDGTVGIRESLNTSSITDVASGQYWQNFTYKHGYNNLQCYCFYTVARNY